MKDYYGTYPFIDEHRGAVGDLDISLQEVAAKEESEVVDRAVERVKNAILDKEIGERHDDPETELLSYPMARILVSLVDEQAALRRYVQAEAETGFETLRNRQWTPGGENELFEFTMEDAFEEFGLDDDIEEYGTNTYRIDLAAYILLASEQWGDEWALVNNPVESGTVILEKGRMQKLLESAITHRIQEGLPYDVPDSIAKELDEEIEEVREALRNTDMLQEVDTVVPELFPPCMKKLLSMVREGEHLEHHARLAITTFLTNIGMTTDEIVELYKVNSSFGEEMTRYQTDHLQGKTGPVEYSPPSCATMKTHGDCYNPDELCESIPHPMSYYERKLDQAEDEEGSLEDWREQMEEEDEAEDGDDAEDAEDDESADDTAEASEADEADGN